MGIGLVPFSSERSSNTTLSLPTEFKAKPFISLTYIKQIDIIKAMEAGREVESLPQFIESL